MVFRFQLASASYPNRNTSMWPPQLSAMRAACLAAEFLGTSVLAFTVGCNVLSNQTPVAWEIASIACALLVSRLYTRPHQLMGGMKGFVFAWCWRFYIELILQFFLFLLSVTAVGFNVLNPKTPKTARILLPTTKAMMSVFGPISGGHFNPSVSVASPLDRIGVWEVWWMNQKG